MQGKSLSSTACRTCTDIRDIVPLCSSQHLYLKPLARINISVQLPQMKTPGKSISSWEVMERLRKMAKPEKFSVLKVTKSTLEFIRFEGEIDSKDKLKGLIESLDMKTIKLSGFPDALKVRAAEAKMSFPTRHVWDGFFREAKNMDEMKPGERPDTMHITNMPCKWFTLPELQDKDPKPSEYIFRKVFEGFGEVRYVDVPCIDPYRSRMKSKSAIRTFSFDDGVMFEGYIQFKEYVGFLKAMNALKGMHLLYKDKDKSFVVPIRVDFDRTKHMTDNSIKKRHVERERLVQQDAELLNKERLFLESVEAKKDKELRQKEADHLEALHEEQEKIEVKKKQKMEKIKKAEKQRRRIKKKLAEEEHKLKMAQAKLENVELLEILLEKAKKKQNKKKEGKKKKKRKEKEEVVEPICSIVDQAVESVRDEEKDVLVNRELELRKRLLLKYKRNLITKLEENSEEEKSDDGPSSLIVDATIAEVDADDNTLAEKDVESEVEIEFEKADEYQITSSSKDNEEDSTSVFESVAASESEENAASTQVEESEGEIKSEGEASDTESELSAIELSDGPSNSKGPTNKKSKMNKDKKKKHKRDKATKTDDKVSSNKINSHVEVVSNHWKRTTHHYTDQDGKHRGDTWIEGKQVYEVGRGGMPPWAYPSDFGGQGQQENNTEIYDKYFDKFRPKKSRSAGRDPRRSVSRDRSVDRFERKVRSRDRSVERPRSRNQSGGRSRRWSGGADKYRGRPGSRDGNRFRRRSRSRSRSRWGERRGRRRSASRSRKNSRSSISLSLSRSRSRGRSASRKISPPRDLCKFKPKSKSRSPLHIKIPKPAKKLKASPVKVENALVKQRPKPLIMKMPSKRPKKVPLVVAPLAKEEVAAPETLPVQSVPEVPAAQLDPDQSLEIERVKSASPTLELECSPVREGSPIPTDSIPLPGSPSKEMLSLVKEEPQTVQEVPVFHSNSGTDDGLDEAQTQAC